MRKGEERGERMKREGREGREERGGYGRGDFSTLLKSVHAWIARHLFELIATLKDKGKKGRRGRGEEAKRERRR